MGREEMTLTPPPGGDGIDGMVVLFFLQLIGFVGPIKLKKEKEQAAPRARRQTPLN